jgi:7-cyano-7-deazaguanine synthase
MTPNKKSSAVCLLSGGLDSATALAVAVKDGFRPLALTIDYGQTHVRELASAKRIAKHLAVEHYVVASRLPWGGSALLDSSIKIPEHRSVGEMSEAIPVTYVPARNTIFLSLAASFAEARDADAIYIGANALDYSGYPDCRPEYFALMERAINAGTKRGVEGHRLEIKTPLIHLKKSEIIQVALTLGVPLEWTWSCYKGEGMPCGVCDSCLLREKGFEEASAKDPLLKELSS